MYKNPYFMNKLYHYPLCPFSRQVRLYAAELNLNINLIKVDYWQPTVDVLQMNPAGTLPIWQELNGFTVNGIYPLTEYMQEKHGDSKLMLYDINAKAEIRRLLSWCNDKMHGEVTNIFVNEKLTRLLANQGPPRTDLLRLAKSNLAIHMNYFSELLSKYSYIASDSMSIADLALASHISIIDYFGEINWDNWLFIRNWYAVIKSRPSFRTILNDKVAGLMPSFHYNNLDF